MQGRGENEHWTGLIMVGQRRGRRDAELVISALMQRLTCGESGEAKKAIADCLAEYRNVVGNKYGIYEALYAQPEIDFPIAETRLGLLEVKFADLISCLEGKACCRPTPNGK
jgi:hypothetical protein